MKFDLTNEQFGRLTADSFAGNSKSGHAMWHCTCECGNKKVVRSSALRKLEVRSCGCLHKESARKTSLKYIRKHGHNGNIRTKTYNTWRGMKERCDNPKAIRYKDYGGRGISYCERWEDFMNFLEDMGERPEGLAIDRIDNDGGYSKENCKWSTYSENCKNKERKNVCIESGLTNLTEDIG
jgi:hypothetical protein